MSHRIRYQRVALRDLEGIFNYVRRESIRSADKLADEIDRGISRLSRYPFSGPPPRDLWLHSKGYRLLIVQEYLIFYKIRGKTVLICRFMHGKRRYAFLI